jgi:hypothetical protein
MSGLYTLAGAAVISAGTGIYEASQSHGLSHTADYEQRTIFGEQQYFEKQLQDLIADPSSVTKLPGYQFQFEQGTQAVARQMASSGFLGSGNEAIALTQYGQGLAKNFYLTQANLLAQLAGITAPSSPSQLSGAATAAAGQSSHDLTNALGELGALYGLYRGGFFSSGTPAAGAGGGSANPAGPI